MATHTLSAQGTLLDMMNSIGSDGNLLQVAKILNKSAPMFKNAPWVEANMVTQHEYARERSLPGSNIIRINKGASSSIGDQETLRTELQGRENAPSYDSRLVRMSPDGQTYLSNKLSAAVEGIGQDFETDLLYGSIDANTSSFDGIAVRLDSLANTMVKSNGGTGSNLSSIYLVAWGATSGGAYIAYPKGEASGITFRDDGERKKDMPDNTTMKVHEHYVSITGGLCVPDHRALSRIPNIDTSSITGTTFNENLLIELVNEMPAALRANVVAYCPRKVQSAVDIRANEKGNAHYTRENVFGESISTVFGVPFRLSEIISQAESQVV